MDQNFRIFTVFRCDLENVFPRCKKKKGESYRELIFLRYSKYNFPNNFRWKIPRLYLPHGGTMRLLSFRLRKCATGSKNPRLSNARRFEGSSNSVTWIVTEYRSLFATFQTRPPLILEFSSSGEKKKEEKRKKMLPPFLLTSHTASDACRCIFSHTCNKN